jgi:hypothetical protein
VDTAAAAGLAETSQALPPPTKPKRGKKEAKELKKQQHEVEKASRGASSNPSANGAAEQVDSLSGRAV